MANSSKIKVPLKFGWLVADKKYHIASTNSKYFKNTGRPKPVLVPLCNVNTFLASHPPKRINHYIWPDGDHCTEILSTGTVCKECLDLHGEDLTFPLIKAKLGVKNPFD